MYKKCYSRLLAHLFEPWVFYFFREIKMIVIVFLDEKKGMMFNHRRQSRDWTVTEKIQKICEGKKLWMNSYSGKLYGSLKGTDIMVENDFLSLAGNGEFCLVESDSLMPFSEKIEEVILYRWNRTYPADVYLDLNLSQWERKERHEFQGSSHEKITEERYERR